MLEIRLKIGLNFIISLLKKNNMTIPISIIIPTYNEEKNLPACLEAIDNWSNDIHIIDSNSTDKTKEIAKKHCVNFITYKNKQIWPKKRQWAIDNLTIKYDWILLLDADEILTNNIKNEIEESIKDKKYNGFELLFRLEFLGRQLKFAYPGLYKTMLFRKGFGSYERLIKTEYSKNELPIETHEHFIVEGKTKKLKSSIIHRNVNDIHDYIRKHNHYSDWNAEVILNPIELKLKPSLFGNQAARRRFIKSKFENFLLFPLLVFVYFYFLRLGLLDGRAGFYYSGLQAIQTFHINAKVYEKINK